MSVNEQRGRSDDWRTEAARLGGDRRLAELADRLATARSAGQPAPEELERLVSLLARGDIEPGDRLAHALEGLARWADEEKPARRAAAPYPQDAAREAPAHDRRPASSAHAPGELESRLEDFARALAEPARRPDEPRPAEPKPPIASLRAALAEIAARQKMLDEEGEGDLEPSRPAELSKAPARRSLSYAETPRVAPRAAPQAVAPDPVASTMLRELRSEIDRLGRSVADLPTRSEIDGMTREMTTLANLLGAADRPAQLDRESLRAIDALVAEVDRLRGEAPSPQMISSLSEEVHAIAARLDVIGPKNSAAIDMLAKRIEDVRAELDHFPRIAAVDGVAAEIQSIIARLDAQESASGPTRQAVEGLSGRVEALDGKIAAIAEAAIARDDALERFDANIRAELDSLPRAEAVSDLGRQIDALTEGLKSRSAIGPALKAVEGLADKVEALDGRIAAATRPEAFDTLGRQIEALTRNLAARQAETAGAAIPAEALSGKLDMLGDRMEQMTSATRARGAAFERVEESVRAIAEQLLASRTGPSGGAIEAEVARLVDGVDRNDGRLDDLNAAFSGLAARIERSCADLGAQAAKSAVEAARDVLGSGAGGGLIESEIAQALTEMRASSAQNERRAADTLEAVRSTLDRLLDRMERIGSPAQALAPAIEPARAEPRRRTEPEPDATEAARAAARRAMAAMSAEQAKPAAPRPAPYADFANDQPIEPGARGQAPQGQQAPQGPQVPQGAPAPQSASQTAAAFIAAARRAQAQPTPDPIDEPAAEMSERPSVFAVALASIKARKRPLLLGIAATLIVFAALYVASGMTGEPEPAPDPAPVSRLSPDIEPHARAAAPAPTGGLARSNAKEAPKEAGAAAAPKEAWPSEPKSAPADRPAEADRPSAERAAEDRQVAEAPAEKPAAVAPRAPARDLTAFAFANGGAPKAGAPDWKTAEPATTGSIARGQDGLPETIGGPTLKVRAASGDPAAQLEIADRLLEGRNVPADPAAAAKWLEKSAAQGLAPAQHRLGSLYEKGRGVARDIAAARRWYEQAAASGNVRAMHNLGVIHAEGGLGKPDFTAAAVWFRMAAERGLVDSQFNLAVLDARGLGGKRDLLDAYKWFALAARQGDEDASRKREEVAKALGSSLGIAKASVDAFRARPVDSAANEIEPPAGGWDRVASRKDESATPQ